MRQMKRLVGFVLAALLLAAPAFAANSEVVSQSLVPPHSGTVITISSIDSDWTWRTTYSDSNTDEYKHGLRIFSIRFVPGAADDECFLFYGTAGTATSTVFHHKAVDDTDDEVEYLPNAYVKPFLDYSEGTYSSGSMLIIKLWP